MSAPDSVYAENGDSASTITVNAVVLPHIYIVFNSSGNIDEVYSNSKTNVEPLVVFDSIGGQPGKYTSEVAAKYSKLKSELKYDRGPGILYEYKQPAKTGGLIKTGAIVSVALRPLTGLPF